MLHSFGLRICCVVAPGSAPIPTCEVVMSHLKFDTRDWKFILHEQYDLKQLLGLKKYADFDIETLDTVADEGIKFAIDVVAPINGPGDAEGCKVADGRVTAPQGYAEAWKKLGANGWNSAIHSPEFGGQGLPLFAMMPVFEAMNGAGQAFFMYSQLTSGAAHLVENFGSEKLKKLYCEKMYTGAWGGTMCLIRYLSRKQARSGKRVSKVKRDEQKKKPKFVEKPFNKGTRVVSLKKRPNNYPCKNHSKPKSKVQKKHGAPKVRKSLQPGTILILLAGVHRGKRVVLLKALKSGLLLVTGPYKINRVPIRRVHQNFVIATSTRLDISKVKIPDTIDDAYFRRKREKRAKKAEGDIFAKKKKTYKASATRKADQITVDRQLLRAIRPNPDRKILLKYLKSRFGLSTGQYPHTLKF